MSVAETPAAGYRTDIDVDTLGQETDVDVVYVPTTTPVGQTANQKRRNTTVLVSLKDMEVEDASQARQRALLIG